MSESIAQPFTPEEMDDLRRSMREEASVRRRFWSALKRIGRNTPFAEDLIAAFYCAIDPDTPLKVRAILFGALGYFILPLDAVSDLLPVIGFTDDIAVLSAAIAAVATSITPAHRLRAREALESRKAA